MLSLKSTCPAATATMDHSYSACAQNPLTQSTISSDINVPSQCCIISSSTNDLEVRNSSSKYKSDMMLKYLRDVNSDEQCNDISTNECNGECEKQEPLLLNKWLESAAKFQPNHNYVAWSAKNITWKSPAFLGGKQSKTWNASGNIYCMSVSII